METSSIFAFVLALVVAGNVALAWIIYVLQRETRERVSRLSTTASEWAKRIVKQGSELERITSRLAAVEGQSPVELGVRVVELADAVERLRKTHQRFAGRISQELGTDGERPSQAPTDRDALRREHASSIMPAGVRK